MKNSIKNNSNFKNATAVAFAFLKGENKALQMLVSRFLETKSSRKYSSHKNVNGREHLDTRLMI